MKLSASLGVIAGLLLANQAVRAQPQASVEWMYLSALDTGGDRVVAFDLKVSNGSIASLPDVPRGWRISITNDASGQTEISGNVQVGAAALNSGYFRRFVGLQRQDPLIAIARLRLDIVVTKNFTTERHIHVPPGRLMLSKSDRL